MPFVTDAHSLVWYMTKDPKLSARVQKIFRRVDDNREQVFILCIVFFELLYLVEKKKIKSSFDGFLSNLSSSDNYKVEPLCIPVIRQCRRILRDEVKVYPYPLSRQKTGFLKVDSSPCIKAVGTEGARRATGVPTATPYTSAGLR